MSAERILVRLPNPVGDAVMATPALRALRRGRPGAEIHALGPAALAALLEGNDSFDVFVPIEEKGLGAAWRRAAHLRARSFGLAVLLPDSPRSALDAFLARVPERVGYARDPLRRALLTRALAPPTANGRRLPISMIERYQRITRAVGCEDVGDALELVVDPSSRERVAQWLAGHGIAGDEPIVVLTPGAAFGASKLWPPEYFASAADEIARRHGLRPVVVPAPNPTEVGIALRIATLAQERCVALTDRPSTLADLKALVERSRLVLTNDTGPRHVAVALDRPVVVVMGPNDPRHTAHLLERQRVLREEVACSPCGKKVCPIDHRCMTRLAPARVVAAAGDLLA